MVCLFPRTVLSCVQGNTNWVIFKKEACISEPTHSLAFAASARSGRVPLIMITRPLERLNGLNRTAVHYLTVLLPAEACCAFVQTDILSGTQKYASHNPHTALSSQWVVLFREDCPWELAQLVIRSRCFNWGGAITYDRSSTTVDWSDVDFVSINVRDVSCEKGLLLYQRLQEYCVSFAAGASSAV